MRIDLTPHSVTLIVGDYQVPCARLSVEAIPGQVPVVTVLPLEDVEITGDTIVQVVGEPSRGVVVDAARDLVARIDPMTFENLCKAQLAQGARDPFAVALSVLKEMTDG